MPPKVLYPMDTLIEPDVCSILYLHPVKDWGRIVKYEIWEGEVSMCVHCDGKCPIAHNLTNTGHHTSSHIPHRIEYSKEYENLLKERKEN